MLLVLAPLPRQLHALASVLIVAAEAGIDRVARRHQDVLNRHAEERTQRVEIVHGGQCLTDDSGYFIDSPSVEFSVNKSRDDLDMTNEFMRFLISDEEVE